MSKPLSSADFDQLCANYEYLQTKATEAKRSSDEAKAEVIRAVEQHGFVPTTAQQSRRVEGGQYVATLTTATSVEIVDSAATELELLLSKAKAPGLFSRIFARRVEYTLVKGAENVLRTESLPKRYAEQITQLYTRCLAVRTKTPSLKVEPLLAVREREEKAAKKGRAK